MDRTVTAAQTARSEPIDRAWLDERLADIRRDGFDRRQSPITYGVTDISFPIFGMNGDVVAALTVPFLELIDGSQRVKLDDVT